MSPNKHFLRLTKLSIILLTLVNFGVFLSVYLHTKRAIDSTLSVTSNAKRNKRTSVLNFSKTKQVCSSLFCQLIYAHIRVLKHTKRVVQTFNIMEIASGSLQWPIDGTVGLTLCKLIKMVS